MTTPSADDVARLPLDELRVYRRALLSESVNTSRWRRLVQARLDLAVAMTSPPERLTSPAETIPGPPETEELRDLVESVPDDAVGLLLRLHHAQRALTGYGVAVDAAASAATRELVERYAAEPRVCLPAPPLAG